MNPITSITLTFADGTTQSFSEQVAVVPAVEPVVADPTVTESTPVAPV